MTAHPWTAPAVALALAFLLSLTIALFYTRLHRGVPYLRTFAQTLAVAGVVSALVVLSIGDNVARGIGLIGAVTLVRFRSNLKDPRDLIFAFAALAVGVAAGAHAHFVAVAGSALFLVGMCLVSRPWFGRTETFDAIVSLRVPSNPDVIDAIAHELRARCEAYALVRVRQAGAAAQEHAYQVVLKDPRARAALVQGLERIHGVGDTQLVVYDRSQDV